MKNRAPMPVNDKARWRNRVLILSLLGIAALTLFPYQFSYSTRQHPQPSFLLLRLAPKDASLTNFVLNVLLFVPLGFAVALRMRGRAGSLWRSLLLALGAGAIVSYSVEFLQLFIPTRDSSWDDVFSNTIGAVAGVFLFEVCGNSVLELASKREDSIAAWVSPSRAAAVLAIYFGCCFGISLVLQQQTRLSNWDPNCSLNVGNDATGENPWKGSVYRLQIWDRVLPENQVEGGVRPESPGVEDASLLVSYDLQGSPPFEDKRNSLPALEWTESLPAPHGDPQPVQDSRLHLSTAVAAGAMIHAIQKTNQFTIRVICAPAEVRGAGGDIVSLSQSSDVNFFWRQEGANLAFWFRNPLSESRASLIWRVANVFEAGKTRDIVATYDGSTGLLYVDGRKAPRVYRLGPGAGLVRKFYYIRVEDLGGYVILYDGLVFLPAGVLLGMAAGRWSNLKSSEKWILGAFLVLPPALLDFLLVWVSGRSVWPENIFLSALFSVAGILWVNSDLRARKLAGD